MSLITNMNYNDKHIKNNSEHSDNDFFTNVEVPYSKSKDEIWDQINTDIDSVDINQKDKIKVKKNRVIKPSFIYSIAATLLILLGTFSILRYLSTTVVCPSGQHLSINLPDGSTVTMNSNSTLTYYPLWWQFSREVSLSGEAFFNVEKGKNFSVVSSLGETMVLGTSFNVFSRDDEYRVACITGKVKIISLTKKQVILSPDYHAEITKNGDIKVTKNNNSRYAIGWMESMFDFTSVPLHDVIGEIEHFYNVTIATNTELDYFYTGYFSKQKPVEEVLNLLCKPFGLTFVKKSENNYEIIQD